MIFLADSNIISEVTRPQPNVRVQEWLRNHEQEIAVDPIILGEIRFGILQLPAGKKRQFLEEWFGKVVMSIVCVPWDVETAMRWARLLADLRSAGCSMPIKDSMIAATALVHDMTIVTRNSRDFQNAGLRVVNPFEEKRGRRS